MERSATRCDWTIRLAGMGDAAFPSRLETALREPLPGLDAQRLMAPQHRQFSPQPGERVRQSAVMALLCGETEPPSLVFTLRACSLRHHAGEVCFPGGGMDPSDTDLLDTAFREVEEELGLPRAAVRVLGALTPLYIAPSQNLVHPFVGWITARTRFIVAREEVERVVEVPLSCLLDPATQSTYAWQRGGQQLTAPCYQVDGLCIWGATAMMLSELLQVVRQLS